MPDVVLIRPGCTDFDEQHRIQGALDLPLNGRGQQQVELVIRQLSDVPLDIVFSGPCEPARSTALAICEECGATYKEVADFRNLNHGLWQGLQVDDVRRKYPKVFKQWQESPETVCLPEGETLAEGIERIQRALKKCLKKKRTVGIVASEPLATLIGCVLRGCRPELPASTTNEHPERMIEILRITDDDRQKAEAILPVAAVADPSEAARQSNGRGNGNGHRSNGGNGSGAAPGTVHHANGNGRNVDKVQNPPTSAERGTGP